MNSQRQRQRPTIESLASDLHEATGYFGKDLTTATLIVAALYADLRGRRDVGDYFMHRAREVQAG
jgi:hypothetical protein